VIKRIISIALLFTITTVSASAFAENEREIFENAISWLQAESTWQIRACKRDMHNGVAAFPPQVGIGYEAFWLRDYAYMLEGAPEAFSEKELLDAVEVFLNAQRDDGACVDCVKFDGTPIYQPGYGSMGSNPVADGSQFTVDVVYCTWRKLRDPKLLEPRVLDSLIKALNAVPRSESGLVFIDPQLDWDRCPYGFHDTIRKQGEALFCSLLYCQAAGQLSEMLREGGREIDAKRFDDDKIKVANSINQTFWDEEVGLYRGATIQCREHDVWGSAFAVYLGVAPEEKTQRIASYFKKHYSELTQNGQVRGTIGGVYWEKGCERDFYQNGAYWGTASGWFIYALATIDVPLAAQATRELINDYRRNGVNEWIFGEKRNMPQYVANAALPIAGLRKTLDLLERQP
jgi:hypothetical protein